MITDSLSTFSEELTKLKLLDVRRSVMHSAMVLTDAAFSVGLQTQSDNHYMRPEAAVDCSRARLQLFDLLNTIQRCGVPVVTFESTPNAPDSVFSNNAYATIDGMLITGAMKHGERQVETAREDIIGWFRDVLDYEVISLQGDERVAELTGVLAIDRFRNFAFCGMSQRVNDAGLEAMAQAFDLDLVYRFDLNSSEYHTNVILAVLAGRAAVVYAPSIEDDHVGEVLELCYPGAVLFISEAEKNAFAANCIAVTHHDVLLSKTAMDALSPQSRQFFDDHDFTLHPVDVSEFEKAGGSLRCMVTEIF